MKEIKIIKTTAAFALILVTVLSLFTSFNQQTKVQASSATSYTLTLDRKGNFVRTQDAYLPGNTVMHLGLGTAEDLFIDHDDMIFIADTDNRRILKYDPLTDAAVLEITHEAFQTPRGIFITVNQEIFVADTNAGSLFVFNPDGSYNREISSIESPSFNNQFRPLKVSVDVAGNIYVLGEGIYDGIIQLSNSGEFLGYFTSNQVNLTVTQMLQDFFFTDAQLANLFSRTPMTFSNVFTDRQGILYTATIGQNNREAIKKHNTAGQNMLNPTVPIPNVLDLYVDHNGIIYAATNEGYIYVLSPEGDFIFLFGADADYVDVAGLFGDLRSLAVDSQGHIWALDREKGLLQSFVPTDYATQVYSALSEFNQGNYEQAIVNWQEVLRLNQMSVLAHNNIARNYFSRQNYDMTMYHAEVAGNRYYFSEAFWEVRNSWLQSNITTMIISVLALTVVWSVVKRLNRRSGFLEPVSSGISRFGAFKPVEQLLFIFPVMRHPINSFYELKKKRAGSTLAAIFLFLLFFVVLVWSMVGPAFIHRQVESGDLQLGRVALVYFGLSLLFVLCNYLVSSIQDGEGSLTDIFKVFVYSMGPILLGLAINTVLSHLMTENEIFILQIIQIVVILWSGILLLLGLQEIHVYETGEAIKSILISIAFMVIIALVGTIIVIMADLLVQFFTALFKEGARNVF